MSVNSKMTAIANAIRSLLGTSGTYTLDTMATAINGITKKTAQSYTPTTSDQTIAAGQYLSGAQTVKGDTNLVAGNIKSGVSIFGVAGGLTTGITPSGTKSINENGNGIDVTNYANVDVAVPTGYLNYKEFEVTVATDFNNGYLTLISADSALLAHRADSTLFITITPMFTISAGSSILGSVNANFKHGESYWYSIRNNTAGGSLSTSQGSAKLITETVTTSYGGHANIDSSGNLKWSATSSYYIRAGQYRVTVRW